MLGLILSLISISIISAQDTLPINPIETYNAITEGNVSVYDTPGGQTIGGIGGYNMPEYQRV